MVNQTINVTIKGQINIPGLKLVRWGILCWLLLLPCHARGAMIGYDQYSENELENGFLLLLYKEDTYISENTEMVFERYFYDLFQSDIPKAFTNGAEINPYFVSFINYKEHLLLTARPIYEIHGDKIYYDHFSYFDNETFSAEPNLPEFTISFKPESIKLELTDQFFIIIGITVAIFIMLASGVINTRYGILIALVWIVFMQKITMLIIKLIEIIFSIFI